MTVATGQASSPPKSGYLGVFARPTVPGRASGLEYEHTSFLAQDEAVSIGIEGAAGSLRLVIAA